MNPRISFVSGIAVALLTPPLFSFGAAAQLAVSSDDTVTVIDLGVSPPKVVAELRAPSSVVGPPQNVAISPDESIALVSANMKLDPADPNKIAPDNRLSVIDLKANPP